MVWSAGAVEWQKGTGWNSISWLREPALSWTTLWTPSSSYVGKGCYLSYRPSGTILPTPYMWRCRLWAARSATDFYSHSAGRNATAGHSYQQLSDFIALHERTHSSLIITATYYFTCTFPCSYVVHTILHLIYSILHIVHSFLHLFIHLVHIPSSQSSVTCNFPHLWDNKGYSFLF